MFVCKYFLKKIVQIIKEECNEIKLIKPLSDDSKILEDRKVNYIVDKYRSKEDKLLEMNDVIVIDSVQA